MTETRSRELRYGHRRLATLAFALVVASVLSSCGSDNTKVKQDLSALQTQVNQPTPTAVPEPTPSPPTPTPRSCGPDDIAVAARSVVRIEAGSLEGSGFVTDDGGIVTNSHVIASQQTVALQLADGTQKHGWVSSVSASLDLAIVRTDGLLPAPLSWGSSKDLPSGLAIFAAGFPLATTGPPVITKGIVSRMFVSGGETYVQTDAAVNPGNSGGPLLDDCGKVIGVVTLKNFGADGQGFAQAEQSVRAEVSQLLSSGTRQAPAACTPRAGQPQCVLSGNWQITDKVTFGPDTGQTFQFTVTINPEGSVVTGSSTSLSFVGTRNGDRIRVNFSRTGGTGYFEWSLLPDGTLAGGYQDYGASNGGTSVASPVR